MIPYGFQEYIEEFKNIPCSYSDGKIEVESIEELDNPIEQYNLSDDDAEDPDDPTPYNSQDYNTSGSSINSLSPPGSDIDCEDTTDLDHDTSNEYDSPLDPDSQSSFSGYSRDS